MNKDKILEAIKTVKQSLPEIMNNEILISFKKACRDSDEQVDYGAFEDLAKVEERFEECLYIYYYIISMVKEGCIDIIN